jgi:undecaprenyl-diphosphatase
LDQAELIRIVVEFFKEYGYYVLFISTLLENVAFIGLIMPGDLIVLIASFMAAEGYFRIGYVLLLAMVGSVGGNHIGYYFGRKTGRAFIEKLGLWSPFLEGRIKAAEKYFDKFGRRTVFFGRFASGVKAFVTALAGSAKMDYFRFLIYSTASAFVWNATMAVLGYFFGANLRLIMKIINRVGLGFLIVIILFVLIPYVITRLRKKVEE